MALKRNAVFRGLLYRGGGPMWSWILHRICGLGMVVFVGMHMLASFFQHLMASDIGLTLNVIYESIYFQAFIYFCVLFHATNGLRIIILDIWPQALEYQREATWLQWLIFIPIYGMMVFLMIRSALGGA
jgi:succinate dehydrogenase / fumarate reductase cytochrome b subunit